MIPAKRSCQEQHCPEKSILTNHRFDRPIQIGQFIYVPIPVMSSTMNNRPLDLSLTKTDNEHLYQCQFCSIRFRQRETLQAHQENYCSASQEQNHSSYIFSFHRDFISFFVPRSKTSLYTCRLCHHGEDTLQRMHSHLQYHLFNGQSCSEEDILPPSMLFKCLICLAMFENENILLGHIRCVHINSKLIQCLECRSKFSSKWNLIRHMKILHTNIHSDDEEKFSNLVRSSSSMRNPLPMTTMNSNYCSFCQISFRLKSSYQAHRLFYCSKRRKIST